MLDKAELRCGHSGPPTETRTTAIFGHHYIGSDAKKRWLDFRQSIQRSGLLPDQHIWPVNTMAETRKLSPCLFTVDGMGFEPDYHKVDHQFTAERWFSLPGNPFSFNREPYTTFILEADVPFSPLITLKTNYPAYLDRFYRQQINTARLSPVELRSKLFARESTHRALIDYWETQPDQDIEDQNTGVARSEKAVLPYKWFTELWGSKFIFWGASWHLLWEAYHRKPISRRKANILITGGVISLLNASRLYEVLAIPPDEYIYNPWAHPLTTLLPTLEAAKYRLLRLDVRDALTSIKLGEADSYLQCQGSFTGPRVAVFGSAHGLAKDLWNDPEAQKEVVRATSRDIFGMVANVFDSIPNIPDPTSVRSEVVNQLTRIFGGAALWRIGKTPENLKLESVRESLIRVDTSVSHIIRNLVQVAAVESDFLPA